MHRPEGRLCADITPQIWTLGFFDRGTTEEDWLSATMLSRVRGLRGNAWQQLGLVLE